MVEESESKQLNLREGINQLKKYVARIAKFENKTMDKPFN